MHGSRGQAPCRAPRGHAQPRRSASCRGAGHRGRSEAGYVTFRNEPKNRLLASQDTVRPHTSLLFSAEMVTD